MSQLSVFDFTLPHVYDGVVRDPDSVKCVLREWAKKWVFQLEESDSGYVHYQGRVSLVKKRRVRELISASSGKLLAGWHWCATSSACSNNMDYVMKADTRKEGPWSDTDMEVYIPRQFRGLTLRPWQKQVIDLSNVFDDRTIHLVYDQQGGHGKSTLAN